MRRILTFHTKDAVGNNARIGPTYYMDADYVPIAARLYAETAPKRDAELDIFDDGVSIFPNRTPTQHNATTGVDITGAAKTTIVLSEGQNGESFAGDFNDNPIEEGSWVHCEIVQSGDGKNFTVQLDVERLSSENEPVK